MPYKKTYGIFIALITALFLCAAALNPAVARGEELPRQEVNARAALLMEPATGKVLMEHNAHEKLPPASVTKVMTILLIYEAVENGKIKWDDMVTTSEHAASMGGSQVFLAHMERQSVVDLTKSVIIASGNDAAVALAEHIAGSEGGFVDMMNAKAEQLGMKETRFVNACGLPAEGHYTSAYDIALMSRELITKYPEVFKYTKTWMDKITHRTGKGESEFGLTNTNKLIKQYPAATGLKTGSTSEALYCISATGEKDGMQLISVILGAPDPAVRFSEAARLMDYGFANYAVLWGDAAGTSVGSVPVFKGRTEQAVVVVKNRVAALISKGKGAELTKEMKLPEAINAPAKAGAKVGEIVYSHDGAEVGRSDLVLTDGIEKAGLIDIMRRVSGKWASDGRQKAAPQAPASPAE